VPFFFIDRPVFAWVIALAVMVAGVLAIPMLPVAQYPRLSPPRIVIYTQYPGASPEEVDANVASVIEEGLDGIEGLNSGVESMMAELHSHDFGHFVRLRGRARDHHNPEGEVNLAHEVGFGFAGGLVGVMRHIHRVFIQIVRERLLAAGFDQKIELAASFLMMVLAIP